VSGTSLDQPTIDQLESLDQAGGLLKSAFVGKDSLVELLLTCAIAQEHLLVVGPPGTAKSELIKRFALLCSDPARNGGRLPYFEYLLTRFTEPNEIFGPINIAAFQSGQGVHRETAGLLPRAEIAFLDEVFKANSAILNSLLSLLNERAFYNGPQREHVPLICAVGATNAVPDDPELAALYDRFLLRVWTDNVEETRFPELFRHGWKLERERIAAGYGLSLGNVTNTESLRHLHGWLRHVNVDGIERDYREVVRRIRAEGIQLSDRRVVKLLKLVAASALRRKRVEASPSDFWVLRHVWNSPEQVPHLQTIVDPYVDAYGAEAASPQRRLKDIEADVERIGARREALRTDADFADLLQQVEALRRELLRHSAGEPVAAAEERQKRDALIQRLEKLIDGVMAMLETGQ
jgi:MoxR-like ATPase